MMKFKAKLPAGKSLAVCVSIFMLLSVLAPSASAAVAIPDSARTYGIELFNADNGIPTSETNAVLQTSDSFLWMGGYGGLQRYDGTKFRQVSGTAGLTSYSIRSLWESPEGTFWVGSNDRGPFYLKDHRFHHIPSYDGTSFQSIRCFAQGQDGTIWLGTAEGLAYVSEEQVVEPFDMGEYGYENSTVYSLEEDMNGLIWGVDYSGSLFAIDSNTHTLVHYFAPGKFWGSHSYAYSCTVMGSGTVAVGMNDNTVYLIHHPASAHPSVTEIKTGELSAINCVYQTSNGLVWCCGDRGMGYIDNTNHFTDLSDYPYTDGLRCLREDYEHGLWISSNRFGVLHLSHNKIASLPLPENEDAVIYTVTHSNRQVYIATNNGLRVMDRDWVPVNNAAARELAHTPMRHVAEDTDGNLWLSGYYDGYFFYDIKNDVLTPVDIRGSQVRLTKLLRNGDLAVAHYGGLYILHEGAIVESYETDTTVLCLEEMEDGSLLCGTDGSGIYRLKDGAFTKYANQSNGLTGGVILRMAADLAQPDHLWVSCGYDLFYGNETGFSPMTGIQDGSGSILEIVPKMNDEIWLFRSSGLLLTKRASFFDSDPSTVECVRYLDNSDGLPGNIVANSWSAVDDSTFWICTYNGVACLDLSNPYYNPIKPKAALVNVSGGEGCTYEDGAVYMDTGVQKVTFEVAALTYGISEAKLRCYLSGFDEEPITGNASDLHDIIYTNIPGGEYTFHIQAYNSDGLPSEELVVPVVKKLHFMETIWFPISLILAAVLCTTAIVMLFNYYRMQRLRERQKLYKSITDQSISTIASAIDAKDPYTNGHSHRVADFSVKLGRRLGLCEEECERLHYIAMLHDIGKIGIPDSILKKKGRLTDEEYQVIKQHPDIGGAILANFTALDGVQEGALYHHERYDGKGYNKHLSGTEIPYFARIIAVADTFDAMNSNRCYRNALTMEDIIHELEAGRGTQFDPHIADLAVQILREELSNPETAKELDISCNQAVADELNKIGIDTPCGCKNKKPASEQAEGPSEKKSEEKAEKPADEKPKDDPAEGDS